MSGGLAEPVHLPTAEQALGNAVRLLHSAEMSTDRQLMERFESLADSWIHISGMLFAIRQEIE